MPITEAVREPLICAGDQSGVGSADIRSEFSEDRHSD
jgi:hypothetical protein